MIQATATNTADIHIMPLNPITDSKEPTSIEPKRADAPKAEYMKE
jgi:hypothetical protein